MVAAGRRAAATCGEPRKIDTTRRIADQPSAILRVDLCLGDMGPEVLEMAIVHLPLPRHLPSNSVARRSLGLLPWIRARSSAALAWALRARAARRLGLGHPLKDATHAKAVCTQADLSPAPGTNAPASGFGERTH